MDPTQKTLFAKKLSAATVTALDGDLEPIRSLLASGCPPDLLDTRGQSALTHAASKGSLPVVEMLVDAGALVNRLCRQSSFEEGTALNAACRKKKWAVASYLLQKGADPRVTTYNHDTAAHIVVGTIPLNMDERKPKQMQAAIDMLVKLLDAGNPVNQVNNHGDTLLTRACEINAPIEVIDHLLERGADPNHKNYKGRAPVHRSWPERDLTILRRLVSAGADVNAKDSKGSSALIYADCPEAVRTLVDMGADVNALDDIGQPVISAFIRQDGRITSSDEEVLVALIECGADPDITDYTGQNAKQILAEIGGDTASRLLALIASREAKNVISKVVGRSIAKRQF